MADFAELVLSAETAGLKKAEPALDALTVKAGKADAAAKKLGMSTKAMSAEATKAATGTKAMATALDQIEVEAKQASVALQATDRALDAMSRTNTVAAGSVGNLTAQFNDIGMMMAAGQNPLQLAIQQGTQISQVLGPMGAGQAVRSLGAAFVSLLNPVNLVVMGVIAGTAALVNWATGAGDAASETISFVDAIDKAKASTEALREVTDLYSLEGLATLKEMYGVVDAAVLKLIESQRLQAAFANERDAVAAISALVEQYGLLDIEMNGALVATRGAMIQVMELGEELGMTRQDAGRLVAAFQELDAAPLADKPRILSEIRDLLNEAGIMTGAWVDAVNQAEAAARAANAEGAKAQGWLAAATAGAQSWAAELWEAAKAAAAARGAQSGMKNNVQGGRGADPRSFVNDPYWRGAYFPSPESMAGSTGGGASGGGRASSASAAEDEANAIQKVIDKLNSEIEAVGQSEQARRLHQELQKAGVSIYSEEGQQIALLVEELTELEAKQKLVAETMRGIENAAQGFFVGVLSGAKDLQTAIGDLLRQLGNLFLNQAFQMLWNGTGGGGGIGGWLAGLFDAGGHIPAGQVGVVGEKRPELVDGRLVTRPTLVAGPADVTGGADTAKMMGVPSPQMASPSRQTAPMQPRVSVAAAPVRVVVLDDPRKIDAWMRSPEGERSAAWQRGRMSNG